MRCWKRARRPAIALSSSAWPKGLAERLGQVVVGAERHAVAQVGALDFGSEKDEGPPGQLRVITENLEHPVTVEHRHHNVADD